MRYVYCKNHLLPVEDDNSRFAIVVKRGRMIKILYSFHDHNEAIKAANTVLLSNEYPDDYLCPVIAKIGS